MSAVIVPIKRNDIIVAGDFWPITPSGDYEADCLTGRQHALDTIDKIRHGTGRLNYFGRSMSDMARKTGGDFSGIEIGFFQQIAEWIATQGQ